MPGRSYSSGNKYRFGFNGKELDADPIQYDYGFRIYDPRLTRFKSIDPLSRSYPHLMPYQFAENSPILFIDLDGLEKALPWYLGENKNGGKPVLTIGLGKIPTAEPLVHGNEPALSDQAIMKFVSNIAVSAWNQVAYTWNDAMGGKTGSQMVQESVSSIEKLKVEDFKKAETWENIGGAIFTAYAFEKIGNIKKIKLSADLPEGTVTKGYSLSSGGKVPLKSTPISAELLKGGGCEALATKIQKSIGGEFLNITPKEGIRLGPVNYSGGQITSWADHVAVLKEGMVYDGLTGSKGMHLGEYKKMFEYNDAINFTPEKEIKIK
jgi:RHS repeat-associated protein